MCVGEPCPCPISSVDCISYSLGRPQRLRWLGPSCSHSWSPGAPVAYVKATTAPIAATHPSTWIQRHLKSAGCRRGRTHAGYIWGAGHPDAGARVRQWCAVRLGPWRWSGLLVPLNVLAAAWIFASLARSPLLDHVHAPAPPPSPFPQPALDERARCEAPLASPLNE